jgi:hypothetical protein
LIEWSAVGNAYLGKEVTLKWKYATALGYNIYRIVWVVYFSNLSHISWKLINL